MEALLNVEEVCRVLGCSREKLRYTRQQQQFPKPLRFGQSLRWRRADLESWIEQQVTSDEAVSQ